MIKLFLLGIGSAFIPVVLWISMNRFSVPTQPSLTIIPTITPTLMPSPNYSGWIPWWEESASLSTMASASSILSTVQPVWYTITSRGFLKETPSPLKQKVRTVALEHKIEIIPTIFNDFDGNRITRFLKSEQLQADFIDSLIVEAKRFDYTGYDLDWEELDSDDSELFHQFVERLRKRLNAEDKILSVTVHARSGEINEWIHARFFDWKRLASITDEIRIMAYDKHNATSLAGPVTPLGWYEQVLAYAVEHVPLPQLIIALPTYGYDWISQKGTPLQHNQMIERLDSLKVKYLLNKTEGAITATYQEGGENHTVWFENAETIVLKMNIAKKYGVNRFTFWHLGNEDATLWEQLR